ncbi:MAG: hypothetical protein KJO09_12195 [Gammaproteobacteria bacterium]|nr:hypothetical protein [Gammaproteobacteria bacterium]
MKPRTRSISGAVLMLAMVPAIIGLLACLPVPIGDPERSRVDPDITGVWSWVDGNDIAFYAFHPYDRRTWLLTGVALEEGGGADLSKYDVKTASGLQQLIENETVGEEGATANDVVLYKAWRTKLGGEWFMTWEGLFPHAEEEFVPEHWFVFRIQKTDANTLDLYMIDGEDDRFDEVKKTRRTYERVIKKHARDPDLFSDEPLRLRKVAPEHREFVEDLATEVISQPD